MRSLHQRFTVTAESSITHSGETLGTISFLRREAFLTPDGPTKIPVISGNALRGVLRDVSAKLTWEAMGEPRLSVGAADVLWSGGSLVKAKNDPVTGARMATVRDLFPHVGLLGAAGGGRLIEGTLSVGKLLPICHETAPFLPAEHQHLATCSIDDLLQLEEYSRLPGRDMIAGASTPGDETASEGTFRFGVESFIAGTTFSTWWSLTNATDAEQSLLAAIVDAFGPSAHIGGRSHIGHGRIRLNTSVDPTDTGWSSSLAAADNLTAVETLQWLA